MFDVERAIADLVERDEVVVHTERGIAAQLAALLDGRDIPMDAVVRLLSGDPGLAVAVLAAACAVDVDTPPSLPAAIERLGADAILDIVRAAVREVPRVRGPLAAGRRSAWRSAAACAIVSRELARMRGVDPDAAWVCGLLHDVGRAAALVAIERLAAGARVAGPAARWDVLVDRWHVSLGLSLVERLGLPHEIADVIAQHHGVAGHYARRSPELVRIVRTAGAIVRAVWEEPPAEDDPAALEDLGPAEADRLAAVAVALPAAVSALERGSGDAPGRSCAETDGAALHESKGEGVRLRLAGREYAAVGVAPHQLVISGPAPLGEGALLEVELLERRGLVFHARVLLSWAEGEHFGALLMPFAVAGPATLEWHGQLPFGASA